MIDTMVNDALWDVFNDYHMGITAENVAEQWGSPESSWMSSPLPASRRPARPLRADVSKTRSFPWK